jgi:hypothetical protein
MSRADAQNKVNFNRFTLSLVSFGEMNGDISTDVVALAKAQAVAVAAKNRQTPVPLPSGMPPQTSLANNTSAVPNQALSMPNQKQPNMPQQGMMPQAMMSNQAPPMQTHNIGKSPQNAGNMSQSPHMSPQSVTPRQSPGPSIGNKPVAAGQTQMQNPQTPNAATPQPANSQTPGAQTPPKVRRLEKYRILQKVASVNGPLA